jgi:uncharacterized protein
MDVSVPLDARLLVALCAVVLAGIAKGVTGMGLPVVGVPLLVALYGDLRLVLPLTVMATALSDVVMVARWRKHAGDVRVLLPFAFGALLGVVAGTHLLTIVRPSLLSGALALVVISFVVASWLERMPTLTRTQALRWGPAVGAFAGIAQGGAGASGPITTGYLMSMQLARGPFLFAINIVFVVIDVAQLLSLAQIGVIRTSSLAPASLVAVVLGVGMWGGFTLQRKIDDRLFRRGILALLSLAAIGLAVRAL